MKYLALIYNDERQQQALGEEDVKRVLEEYRAFGEWLATEKPGKKVASDALKPVHTATTVRVRDGKRLVTDGPFAETREQLGGYYLLECDDLDEALEIAARIPGAKDGSIEVRPIMIWE